MEDLTKNSSKILKGISWSSLLSFLTYSLAIIKIFILARLIFPEDFGIMALSLLFVNIIKQFSNLGLEQAFIQDDKYNKKTINTIWTVSILRGLFFFLLINISKDLYSNFFNNKELITILTIISFGVLFTGFKNSYLVLYQKEISFDKIFKVNSISTVLEFCVTISLAYVYRDATSLAFGYLLGSITNFLLSFILISRRPNLELNLNEFKRLFQFGKWVLLGGIIIFIIVNIDISIVGKLLGVTILGYYQIAYRIGNFIATDIILNLTKSIYPSFSLVKKNKKKLVEYFLFTIQIIISFTFPFVIIIFFYTEEFVYFFLGSKWIQIVAPLKILMIFGAIRSIAGIIGFVFWTIGEPNINSKISSFQLILIIVLILPLTKLYGITGTAISITIPLFVSMFISSFLVIKKLNIPLLNIFKSINSSIFSLIFLILFCFILKFLSIDIDTGIIFLLFSSTILIIYFSILIIFDYFGNKKIWNAVFSLISLKKNE